MYRGDLNTEHLNNELLLVQYPYVRFLNGGAVFRSPFEYQTKLCPVFQRHANTGRFGDWATFDHLNTSLVQYSDHRCTDKTFIQIEGKQMCF